MDFLWSPWRYRYVTEAGGAAGCIFCDLPSSGDDQRALIVHRGERNFVILNRFPYTSGHLMVVPYAHVPSIAETETETLQETILLARQADAVLRRLYRPDGMNLGINEGAAAGAGVAGHVHLHVLPRWTGDTNFMTVIGETRVQPEDLAVTYQRVRAAFAG